MATNGAHQIRYVAALLHDTGPDQHYRAGMPMEESAIRRLAHAIRTAREARGWTQPDLARESGVSRPTVQRYENAKIPSPEPDPVRRIFKALDLDPREIPVILGLVTRDEMGLPPVAPVRRFSATTEQLIELLEDPDVSDAEKLALVELLRARRRHPAAVRDLGGSRKAG
jgi:transcriptional regulator with XRE-family HTH domain